MADDSGAVTPTGENAPSAAEPEKKKTKKGILIGVGIALVLGLIGGAVFVLLGEDDASAGEVFLEPANFIGDEPFSDQPLADEPDPSLLDEPTDEVPEAPDSVQVSTTAGGEPGLYGGTQDSDSCDAQQLVDFLAANPDKAAAWVAALNTDPNLRWDRGALTVQDIPDYVATLTPVILMADTRVTNHGFSNGQATPLQSVLARGTAVLVDQYGVPRTKCYCGNPLLPPTAADGKVTYVGHPWVNFNPVNVQVVVQNNTVITNFTLVNINNGRQFQRPAGSRVTGGGGNNGNPPPTTTATTVPPTTTAAPVAGPPPASQCTPDVQTPASAMTITNNTASTVDIIWHGFDCAPVAQGSIPPGGTLPIDSYVGHIFSAVDPTTGAGLGDFTVPSPGSSSWTVS